MAGGEAATPLLDCMRHNRDCVCDGDEMTCHVIGYFDAKFILDRYDEFHKIHGLGAQGINKGFVTQNLRFDRSIAPSPLGKKAQKILNLLRPSPFNSQVTASRHFQGETP